MYTRIDIYARKGKGKGNVNEKNIIYKKAALWSACSGCGLQLLPRRVRGS